jgi:hypothetical protein
MAAGLTAPQRCDNAGLEGYGRAVVATAVRMVIALLLAGVHAVRERGIQLGLESIRVADEAAAAHEHNRETWR